MKKKSVVVTGGAGFIGTHMVQSLIDNKNEVVVIDNLSVGDNNVSFLERLGAKIYVLDISDFEKIKGLFKGADCVFHLAAMNRAQRSVENPLIANKWNVEGTINVLEASRLNDVQRVINISSSSVYAKKTTGLLKEDDNVQPPHPYGVSKLAGEHYSRIYNEIYGLKTTTLRYFSVYGPRQLGNIDKAGVVAKFIYSIKNNLPLEIYGDGNQTRNFTYVSDVVKLTLNAAGNPKAVGETINIASEKEVSVNNIVHLIEKYTGKKAKIKYCPRLKGDPVSNPADITKAKRILGHAPCIGIEEGIKNTVNLT